MPATPTSNAEIPQLSHLYTLTLQLKQPLIIGGANGSRFIFEFQDGHFEGERLRGRALPMGGDWAKLQADQSVVFEAFKERFP